MARMPQISKYNSSLLYARGHFIRCTTTRWDTTTQVTKTCPSHAVLPLQEPRSALNQFSPATAFHTSREQHKTYPYYLPIGYKKHAIYLILHSVVHYRPHILRQIGSCLSKYKCRYSHMKTGPSPNHLNDEIKKRRWNYVSQLLARRYCRSGVVTTAGALKVYTCEIQAMIMA